MSTRILKKISLITTQYHWAQRLLIAILLSLGSVSLAFSASLKGTVETANGTPLCALAIASGQSTFTCAPAGVFSFQDLPLEPDGTIKLQLYADGFYPNVTTLSVFNPQQIVMQPAEICDGGGGGPLTNKQKTESLIGTWYFQFTIISAFDDTYTLRGPAYPFDAYPGNYLINGTDTYGNSDTNAGYNDTTGSYLLVDRGITINQAYDFDYVSSNSITGCYYLQDRSTSELSRCYPLTGTRISSASAASNSPASRQVYVTPLDKEERLVREVEASSMARASLYTSSSESTEEASERAARETALERLTEALQAR
jgi:hypothetical protein